MLYPQAGARPPRRHHRAARGRQVHARRGAHRRGRARPAGPVAVVAVDPSSPITGGALLGDRVRMQAYAERRRRVHPLDGVARPRRRPGRRRRPPPRRVLDAAGFDLVLIETVGTGQSEVEVAAAADTTVVLQAPEMGDEVQAIKAGLLEVADIVVVNKGDRPGAAADRGPAAGDAHRRRAARPGGAATGRGPKRPEVLLTTALDRRRACRSCSRRSTARRGAARPRRSGAGRGRAQARRGPGLGDPRRARLRERLRDPDATRRDASAILRAVAAHELTRTPPPTGCSALPG